MPIAQVRETASGSFEEHELVDHLGAVSAITACFASDCGSAEWGRLAGLWHDLGKYQSRLQERIRAASARAPHPRGRGLK